jgi:hypothetical protein
VTNNQTPPVQVYAWTQRFPHQFNHDQNTKGIVMNSNTNPSYGTEPTIPHTVAWQQANQHQDPYHTHISFPPQPAPPKRRNRMWGWIAALVVGSVLLCIAISALIALASPKPKRSFNDPIAEASASKYVTQPAANPGGKMGTPTKQAEPAPAKPDLGVAKRDGKFEFIVSKVAYAQTIPNVRPQGQFVVVTLSVRNIGKEARTWADGSQYAYDAGGRKFSADSGAGLYVAANSGSTWIDSINPGNAVTGKIVFDIPAGATLIRLELHDSMFSGGVKVNL